MPTDSEAKTEEETLLLKKKREKYAECSDELNIKPAKTPSRAVLTQHAVKIFQIKSIKQEQENGSLILTCSLLKPCLSFYSNPDPVLPGALYQNSPNFRGVALKKHKKANGSALQNTRSFV